MVSAVCSRKPVVSLGLFALLVGRVRILSWGG